MEWTYINTTVTGRAGNASGIRDGADEIPRMQGKDVLETKSIYQGVKIATIRCAGIGQPIHQPSWGRFQCLRP